MTEMWDAVRVAWQEADLFTLTVLLGFVGFCGLIVCDGVWRWIAYRIEGSDYEPRATPSEKGIW